MMLSKPLFNVVTTASFRHERLFHLPAEFGDLPLKCSRKSGNSSKYSPLFYSVTFIVTFLLPQLRLQ